MVGWTDIDVRIPTVIPERAKPLASLTSDLYAQTGVHASVHPRANRYDRVESVFGRASERGWILHIEDDVRLSSRFSEVIPRVLDETSRVAVSFFDLSNGEHGLQTLEKPFYMAQCLAVSSSISVGFVSYYDDWIDNHTEHKEAMDLAFGDYTTELGEPIDLYRPSQVQHRDLSSTLGGRSTARQSPTFEG